MARQRKPLAKAEVDGSRLIHPGRFTDRTTHMAARKVGEPYAYMSATEKQCWREFAAELPWVTARHRMLLALACRLSARLDSKDGLGVSGVHALSSILSKLGATPVDECRVTQVGEEVTDPADRFFGKPN